MPRADSLRARGQTHWLVSPVTSDVCTSADKQQQRTKVSLVQQLDMKIMSVLRPFPRYTHGAEVTPPSPTFYFCCGLPSVSLKPLSIMDKRGLKLCSKSFPDLEHILISPGSEVQDYPMHPGDNWKCPGQEACLAFPQHGFISPLCHLLGPLFTQLLRLTEPLLAL